MSKLTMKQKRFCDLVLSGSNYTQAAKDAGFSAKNANSYGTELINKPCVAKYIEEKQAKIADELNIKAVDIQRRVLQIAKTADKANDRLTAERLLGQSIGLFSDATNIHNTNVFTERDTTESSIYKRRLDSLADRTEDNKPTEEASPPQGGSI